MVSLLLACTYWQIWLGIDPKQIRNFKTMPEGRREEILKVFPLPASARYVSMGACLMGVCNVRSLSCLITCINSKKRKADEKEKGEGGTQKKPKEDPQEKVLRVSAVLEFMG